MMGAFSHHQRDFPLCEGIVVSSNFDSGNICDVSLESSGAAKDGSGVQFTMRTASDCANSQHETKNRSWFYFSVTGISPGTTARFRVANMNKQTALYSHGMRPVFRSSHGGRWGRIPDSNVSYTLTAQASAQGPNFTLTFYHKFVHSEETVTYFAFCYPFSYAALQAQLDALQEEIKPHRHIYFKREALAASVQGRRIEMVTVTSAAEETGNNDTFLRGKPVVVVSARVHPGETPSSFVLNGFLQFVLDPHSARAAALRDTFVFHILPMLNPDGVALGHYRANTLGMNLNRFYDAPDPQLQPSIFAAKNLAMSHARRGKLYLYLDLHAHANKRGIFLYGNHLPTLEEQIENVLFGELIGKHCRAFESAACNYSLKNMKSSDKNDRSKTKESSCRVAMYAATKLAHCYTLETNYNRGTKGTTFYTPKTWQECGKACANALLDLAASQQVQSGLTLSRAKQLFIEDIKLKIRSRLIRTDSHYASTLLDANPPQDDPVPAGTVDHASTATYRRPPYNLTNLPSKPARRRATSAHIPQLAMHLKPSHRSEREERHPRDGAPNHLQTIYHRVRPRKHRNASSRKKPHPVTLTPPATFHLFTSGRLPQTER